MAALNNQMANLTVGRGVGPSGGVVYTEQRGIHIRELSRRASEEQVRRMICEAAGREASLINAMDVPLDKEGSPRGYATVHFRSADLARRMEARLHGADFKGKKLQVRLLKEGEVVGIGGCGAVANPPARSHGHGHGHGHRSGKHHISSSSSRRDEGRRAERRDRDKERGPGRGEKKVSSTSSASKDMPLVVGGGWPAAEASACSTPSSSSRGKDKGKEKHSGKRSAVVIADGSSRRAEKS
jgi:RNA recognition motif-containing protein